MARLPLYHPPSNAADVVRSYAATLVMERLEIGNRVEWATRMDDMPEDYGSKTNVPCRRCGRKIFVGHAEVFIRHGRRCLNLKCRCGRLLTYAEDELESHGTC